MEIIDKYDNKRQPLNKQADRMDRIPNEYSLEAHIWIINSKGEYLIQKRSPLKRRAANLWAIHGGAVDTGETTLDAAIRETREEIGVNLKPDELELLFSYRRKLAFTDIYLARKDVDLKDIVMQEEEVSDVKWVTEKEFESMMKEGLVSPKIKKYYPFYKKVLHNKL